jgi:hypothetical protein
MRADITQELKEINEGQYGEEIRWPIYFALCKIAQLEGTYFIVDNLGNYMISSDDSYITAKE